jgi:hypothetical protein
LQLESYKKDCFILAPIKKREKILKIEIMQNYNIKQLKKIVKKEYPNALKIELGNNNTVNGIWFEKDLNAKCRTFIPFQK